MSTLEPNTPVSNILSLSEKIKDSKNKNNSATEQDVEKILLQLKQGRLTNVLAQLSAGEIKEETFKIAFHRYQSKKKLIDLIELFAS